MQAPKKTKSLSSSEAVKKDQYNLPSHNALARILPNNRFTSAGVKNEVQREVKQEPKRPLAKKPNINHIYQIQQPSKRPPVRNFEDGPYAAGISSVQTKEVENFQMALSGIAEDITVLKAQVGTLEAENKQRADLSVHQDLRADLLNDPDISSMTQAEISTHIASLKFKLTSESSRIQQLQNDLIKKNDSEKELLKLQRVQNQQQQQDLRHHQSCLAKMTILEATVKQQDEVIEKMKKALDSNLNNQSVDKMLVLKKQRGETQRRKEEEELALAEENRRLRKKLDRICQRNNSIIQQSKQANDERQILLHRAEQAEARAQALKVQLEENSKQWGRQKQDMLTKLREHRHSFVRTSTITFHKDTMTSVSQSLSKQKPIKPPVKTSPNMHQPTHTLQ